MTKTQTFRQITVGSKLLHKTKAKPSAKFKKLIQSISKELTTKIYPFILYQQQQDSASSASTSKITKEARIIPNLIYCVEQCEQHTIKLTKNSNMDLTRWMRHSTARDFRIITANLTMETDDKDKEKNHGKKSKGKGQAKEKKKGRKRASRKGEKKSRSQSSHQSREEEDDDRRERRTSASRERRTPASRERRTPASSFA